VNRGRRLVACCLEGRLSTKGLILLVFEFDISRLRLTWYSD
jgi:hypothetical protein